MYRYEVRIYDQLADQVSVHEIDADSMLEACRDAQTIAGRLEDAVVTYIAELDAPIDPQHGQKPACAHDWLEDELGAPFCTLCGQDKLVDCPNHGGAFDCTPFCPICQGEQAYNPEEQDN